MPAPRRSRLRRALLAGDWDVFGGAVFTEWDRDRDVVPPFRIPEPWQRWAGIDYGYRAPWAVVWAAVDRDGRVWVYRELYATEAEQRDQARRILEAERDEPPAVRVADPAMWSRQATGASIADVPAPRRLTTGCHPRGSLRPLRARKTSSATRRAATSRRLLAEPVRHAGRRRDPTAPADRPRDRVSDLAEPER